MNEQLELDKTLHQFSVNALPSTMLAYDLSGRKSDFIFAIASVSCII